MTGTPPSDDVVSLQEHRDAHSERQLERLKTLWQYDVHALLEARGPFEVLAGMIITELWHALDDVPQPSEDAKAAVKACRQRLFTWFREWREQQQR